MPRSDTGEAIRLAIGKVFYSGANPSRGPVPATDRDSGNLVTTGPASPGARRGPGRTGRSLGPEDCLSGLEIRGHQLYPFIEKIIKIFS